MRGIDVTPTNQVVPSYDGTLYLEIRNLTSKHVRVPRFAPLAEMFFSHLRLILGRGQTLRETEAQLPMSTNSSASGQCHS